MRRFPLILSAAALLAPAAASAATPPRDAPRAFGAPPLTDAALAAFRGSGPPRAMFVRQEARDEFESFGRLTAQTLPVTFDNWFNAEGATLIAANVGR